MQKVIIYPLYKEPVDNNDIAIIKLEKKVDFTDTVKPACIVTNMDPFSQTPAEYAGFGYGFYAKDVKEGGK